MYRQRARWTRVWCKFRILKFSCYPTFLFLLFLISTTPSDFYLNDESGNRYCLGAISSWFETLPAPATATAFASMLALSSSERTGPLRVTLPYRVMILMLW